MRGKRAIVAVTVALCGFFIMALPVWSLEVVTEEVQKGRPVVFQNYVGEHDDVDSPEAIRQIGSRLASLGNFDGLPYTINNKYTITEVTNDAQDGLYSAAIISIDPSARVDHIRNVRAIVSGYLQGKYQYSRGDADTLAFFLSFYNAVYRGDVTYLSTVYKPQLANHITAANAGLALSYREWPGNTRFVIPLADRAGIPLSQLGANVTAAAAAAAPDANVDARTALIEQKEQDIRRQTEAIAQDRQAITQNESDIAAATRALPAQTRNAQQQAVQAEAAQNNADRARADAEAARAAADEARRIGAPDAAQREAAATQAEQRAAAAEKAAEDAKKAADEAQRVADETQRTVDERTVDNTNREAQVANRQNEVAAQRQQIANETRAVAVDRAEAEIRANPQAAAQRLVEAERAAEGRSPIVGDKFYYMDVKNYQVGGHYHNEMLAIDPDSGTVIARSEDDICSRNFVAYGKGVVVVTARDDSHAGPHDLTMLDLDTLKPLATSQNIAIFWRSPVNLLDGMLYVIVIDDKGKYRLARFNDKMEIDAQSDSEVDPDTEVTLYKSKIYLNLTGQKQIVVLNSADLSTLSQIKP